MKGFQKIGAVFAIAAMFTSFAACGSKGDAGDELAMVAEKPTQEQSENTTAAPGTPSGTAPEENPGPTRAEGTGPAQPAGTKTYTVTLPDGTELAFDGVPQRIVSMGPNITEILYAIGAGDKLVGRTDYCDYPEEALLVESIGDIYGPDVERIIELQPDLVVASIHFSGEMGQRLAGLGIPTAVLYNNSTSMEGVYDMIRAVGRLVGYVEEAEALAARTQERIEAVEAAAKAAKQRPSVYYVVGYGEYGDFTAGGDTFIGQMIAYAGGDNIAASVSGWSYTLEALLEADPDIVIIGLGEAEGFKAAENYRELGAVKHNMVVEVDRNLFDRQGYRNAEGMEVLAGILLGE